MIVQRKGRKHRPPSPEERQFYKDVSYRLGVLRRHLGHTPQSFAAGLGMTVRAYIAYERGDAAARDHPLRRRRRAEPAGL